MLRGPATRQHRPGLKNQQVATIYPGKQDTPLPEGAVARWLSALLANAGGRLAGSLLAPDYETLRTCDAGAVHQTRGFAISLHIIPCQTGLSPFSHQTE